MNDDADHGARARQESSRRAAVLRYLAGHSGIRTRAAARTPEVEEALRVFGSERDLLLAAHQRWQVHLLAQLDQVLERGAGNPHDDVLRAVEELGRVMPGIADLLREHAHDPVLDASRRRLAAFVEQACPCGRRHPLVAPATVAPPQARCAVRRAGSAVARWRRRHCSHRRGATTWQYS